MVAEQTKSEGGPDSRPCADVAVHRFVLRPNQSMSWRGNLIFLAGLFGLFAVTGVAFAFMGFWPVLPFAGLDLALVAYALYRVSRSCQVREVIRIDERSVTIEKGRRQPETSDVFQRAWARLQWRHSKSRLRPNRLFVRSHGRSVEIGSFLTEEERSGLADALGKHLRVA